MTNVALNVKWHQAANSVGFIRRSDAFSTNPTAKVEGGRNEELASPRLPAWPVVAARTTRAQKAVHDAFRENSAPPLRLAARGGRCTAISTNSTDQRPSSKVNDSEEKLTKSDLSFKSGAKKGLLRRLGDGGVPKNRRRERHSCVRTPARPQTGNAHRETRDCDRLAGPRGREAIGFPAIEMQRSCVIVSIP